MNKSTYTPPRNIDEALIECQPSINKLVRKFTKNHYYLREDLQQNAVIGVCEAFKRYDPKYKNKFSTFAYSWIFHYTKCDAVLAWNRMNDTYEFSIDQHDNDGYQIDDNIIDVERTLDNFDMTHQVVFERRMAGYTFDEISKELNITNLQKARKMYLAVESKLKMEA